MRANGAFRIGSWAGKAHSTEQHRMRHNTAPNSTSMSKLDGTMSKFDGTFRNAGFRFWPMGKTGSFKSSHTKSQLSQEEKNEEREKSPHTPLKEKEARKEEPLYAGAHARV